MDAQPVITQAELDRLKWFHEFEFVGGLTTRRFSQTNTEFHRVLEAFVADQLAEVSFDNKDVIDVGCWDGWYSFLAEESGARSVTAVDDFSQNWGAEECFRLAKQLKRSKVLFRPDILVYDLNEKLAGKSYDIVLFLGVYYHLHSPYSAFAQLRRLCHDETLVFIEGDCIRDMAHSYAQMNLRDPREYKFVPTTALLSDMLRSCYLTVDSMKFLNDYTPGQALRRVSPEDLLELVSRAKTTPQDNGGVKRDRAFIACKPFSGYNNAHQYPPPFGLERFGLPFES